MGHPVRISQAVLEELEHLDLENEPEAGINYEKLQCILEQQYDRKVTLQEAIGTGEMLLNIYEILLDNRGENDTL